MDEKYGGAGYWNVVVGESFDVSTFVIRLRIQLSGIFHNKVVCLLSFPIQIYTFAVFIHLFLKLFAFDDDSINAVYTYICFGLIFKG